VFHWPHETPGPRGVDGGGRKSQTKLPPVSLGCKENAGGWAKDLGGCREKLRKLGRVSNRILHESNLMREQISEVLR
jgi:hypothetical protein